MIHLAVNRVLESIHEVTDKVPNKIVNYICLSKSSYIRYRNLEPNHEQRMKGSNFVIYNSSRQRTWPYIMF